MLLGLSAGLHATCFIQSPNSIANGQTGTYFTSATPGATYYWTVTGMDVISGGGISSTHVTVKNNGVCSGSVRLVKVYQGTVFCEETQLIDGDCNNRPPPPQYVNVVFDPCEKEVQIRPSVASGATSYTIYVDNNLVYQGGHGWVIFDYTSSLYAWMGTPTFHQVCVSASNSHGTSSQTCTYYNGYDWCSTELEGDFKTTNLSHGTAGELHVFPNPATDRLSIMLDSGEPASTVQIFDLNGKLIVEKVADTRSLDVMTLPSGLYMIRVGMKDGKILTSKFMKE